MKKDCFEISFKEGCDKPVHFVQTMRYPDISLHRSYIENWWFYPSTKKVDGNSYYVYKNKKTKNIFNVNINIVVSEIMKKVSNDSIICFFDNKNAVIDDICGTLSKCANIVFNSEITDEKKDVSNKTVIIVSAIDIISFLDSLYKKFEGNPKNIFCISIINASENIRRITERRKYIEYQPDNEIWYKTITGTPIVYRGDWLFGRNKILSNEYKNGKGILKYKYSVKDVEYSIFDDNLDIAEVFLPKTVKSINRSAFDGCKMLKNINFPDNIEYIGDSAFWDAPLCGGCAELCLPKKLRTLDNRALATTKKLVNIVVWNKLTDDGINNPCFPNTSYSYSTIYVASKINGAGLKHVFSLFNGCAYVIFDEKTKQILKIIHTEYGDRRI